MKRNGLLKISGILLFIGDAVAIIVGIIALAGVEALAVLKEGERETSALKRAVIIRLLGAIFELVAGISGVKNTAKMEKETICIVFGCIVIVLSIAGNVPYSSLTDTAFKLDSVGLLTGTLLPLLYLIVAFHSKINAVNVATE